MAHTYNQKMMAEIDGDFVVFLIGMRINKPWKLHKWLPVALAMPRMLKELAGQPDAGLLGYVQYWRRFENGAMAHVGLAKAGRHVPVSGARDSARGRMQTVEPALT